MCAVELFAGGKIGDRSGNFQDAVVGTNGEAEVCEGLIENAARGGIELAVAPHGARAHLRIRLHGRPREALALNRACGLNALADRGRALSGCEVRNLVGRQRRHFDLQVDAVEQGTGDLAEVTSDLRRRTDALPARVVEVAACALLRCLFAI
jgi:hypothetical protein